MKDDAKDVSILVPVLNEEGTIKELHERVSTVMDNMKLSSWEVIFIDDGSNDSSWSILEQLTDSVDNVIAIRFRRNFGKAAALSAGFSVAKGDVIITMDADLQDDPKEIPRFLEMIQDGYDLVSGWKRRRLDPLSKTLPSRLFNKVTAKLTGIDIHDFNCGFKAYRAEVVKNIKLYGELHRYIPVLAKDRGFRIGEIAVEHHPRKSGKSKYGWERYARGFLDLLTVLAITRYFQKPGHLFGGFGMLSGIIGTVILFYLGFLWALGVPIDARPLFFIGIMLVILAVQLVSLGMLGELIVRRDYTVLDRGHIAEMVGKEYPNQSREVEASV